jgi:hypothetical protein
MSRPKAGRKDIFSVKYPNFLGRRPVEKKKKKKKNF